MLGFLKFHGFPSPNFHVKLGERATIVQSLESALASGELLAFCGSTTGPLPDEIVSNSSAGGNLTVLFRGRLDNREELHHLPGLETRKLAELSDADFVLAAYRKWDQNCVEKFLGDWAFAIWDADANRLFVARDQIGTSALFYHQNSERLVFASSLKELIALPGVPHKLNRTAVAQLGVNGRQDHLTFYEGVYQLTPGRTLTVTDGRVNVRQYWDPSQIPQIRLKNDVEYLELFDHLYSEAVRCRLRGTGKKGILLSSGLDSSSTAAIAAPQLARTNERLHSLTLRPQCEVSQTVPENRNGDEWPLVQEISQEIGNIDPSFIAGSESNPLELLEELLEGTHRPCHPISTWHWRSELLKAARDQGIQILLTGDFGNFTVTTDGNRSRYLRSLLLGGRWKTYGREVRGWKQARQASPWRTVASQFAVPLLNNLYQRGREVQRGIGGCYPARGMVRESFARPLLKQYGMAHMPLERKRRKAPRPLSSIYNIVQSGSLSLVAMTGESCGLDARVPVMDRRIVEFCLGIPESQYLIDGNDRMLVRRAMKNSLPEKILWNKHRGRIAGDFGQRICQAMPEFQLLLQQFENSHLIREILEVPKMKQILERLPTKLDSSNKVQSGITFLMRGIGIGKFLLRFDD